MILRQTSDVIWRREGRGMGGRSGAASVLDVQPLFLFIKQNWICVMTRIHAELNTNILLTRNFPIDSGVRKWRHPLMIPLHCLWAKSNNRMWRAWFCFCIDFVRSHALCGCCSIVFLREWGDLIENGLPRSRGGKVLDVDGQERW